MITLLILYFALKLLLWQLDVFTTLYHTSTPKGFVYSKWKFLLFPKSLIEKNLEDEVSIFTTNYNKCNKYITMMTIRKRDNLQFEKQLY